MSDLVQRLASGTHRIVFGRPGASETASDLQAAIERKYVLLKFPDTRGGTELGMLLDLPACQLGAADFAGAQGAVHLEGDLKLDYVAVRLIVDLSLASLEGQGCLRVASGAVPTN
jgi:hypothetical protein